MQEEQLTEASGCGTRFQHNVKLLPAPLPVHGTRCSTEPACGWLPRLAAPTGCPGLPRFPGLALQSCWSTVTA